MFFKIYNNVLILLIGKGLIIFELVTYFRRAALDNFAFDPVL